MTQEEKTLFLFAQTCVMLSSPSSTVSVGGSSIPVPQSTRIKRNFDAVYEELEQKLNEKLNNQSIPQDK
ncbi:TPA: hypothetical protein NP701_004231 [Klebsiella pneumoniae]|uniref:hypothetical protein n=1 Tax=Klebsiella pneumoniae TaxID=573 RepID=UPI001E2D25A9|nr:hypothetical protein [Klebsiella pneumoniae]HBU7951904.1 hypothetical protein [Klebsiella pneumoniae]HBV6315212.1 hypothetical protein [Klebsiella pneumoniae]HBV7275544.1 hypothetical protein [Klebsiella pneumoniae]HBW6303594.1 hypothetical protein [Klebsiella pneumoniae]HCI7976126.1 hypothetical protein [Klebsiella pneumoniae]